jgi:hypothetical protein
MKAPRSFNSSWRASPWFTVALVAGTTALPVLKPALLTPIAGGYQAVCERFPLLALMTLHAPALSVALMLALVGLALSAVLGSGVLRTGATIRTNARLSRAGTTLPPRLTRIAANLELAPIGRDAYDRMIGLALDDLSIDCCITTAPCGGEVAGRSPVNRGKQGLKRSLAVDAAGIPLATIAAPANRHDAVLLEPTLAALRFTAVGMTIHLDRGYDS